LSECWADRYGDWFSCTICYATFWWNRSGRWNFVNN